MMLVPVTFLVSLAGIIFSHVLMFKIVNELTPPYLRELFEYRSTGYNLKNSENTLFVPKP